MERYIRTKDGKVYDTERYAYAWSTSKGIGLGISVNESIFIPKSLIEKQADTLPELCDAFVVVTDDGRKITCYSYEAYVLLMMECKEEGIRVEAYGAIWTTGEKGEPILKSVAKRKTTEGKEDLELL